MKMQLGAVMVAALILSGCTSPTPDAKQVAGAEQAAPRKKCTNQTTGSRLGPCDASSTPDVQGTSGDAYRDGARMMNNVNPAPPH